MKPPPPAAQNKMTKPKTKICKKPFNCADPFASTSFGPRKLIKYKVHYHTRHPREVTFTYPNQPPTAQQLHALMSLRAVACGSCSWECMANNECHVGWLLAFLERVLDPKPPSRPAQLSSAISAETVKRAAKTGDWSEAARVHEWAYIERGAVLLMRKGHPRGLPKLIPHMTSGASIFGNPFTSIPIKLNWALFHRYMEGAFKPLTQADVDRVVEELKAEEGAAVARDE